VVEGGIVGVECERDEALKPAGLILQLAQGEQVIDPLLSGFDMAVEHRAVRRYAGGVDRSCDLEPTRAVGFVIADFIANPIGEDLSTASRTRVETRVAQARDQLLEIET
jgi:hypothetical protein